MPYPTKPKGGWQRPCQVVVNKSTVQIREKKATQKFVNKYQDILQNNIGGGTQRSSGSIFFYQEGGKTYASLPGGDAPEHTEESTFRENAKRLQGRRHQNTQGH